MSLVGELIIGILTLLFGFGGLVFAGSAVREFAEAARVVTGPEELPSGDEQRRTYLDVTVAGGSGTGRVALGQVHDSFGYWLVRYWATGASSNLFTIVGRGLLKVLYGPDDYRSEDDRRRGWAVLPAAVPVREDGRHIELALGEDAYPLQRLEADGGTVPFFAGVGALVVGLLVVLSPALSFVVNAYPVAGLAVGGLVVGVPAAVVAGKLYHDTALVGRWSTVTGLDDDAVPGGLAAAGDTGDPDGAARVDLATAEPGDALRVVGTVESTAEGLRVTDGVVSTRGRWFLALAATLDAVRTAVFAAVALVVAAVGVVMLFPSVVGL